MRTLYLLRHGLTEANERRLYCGRTDISLSEAGAARARELRVNRPMPVCELHATSGMIRADETLALLTDRKPGYVLPELKEMDFGRFEMLGYDDLKHDPDYLRWIEDKDGVVPCPGGESSREFTDRVRRGGMKLLEMKWDSAVVVCHGGTVVRLMDHWFPNEKRNFYEWQPAACGGWKIEFNNQTPVGFNKI